MHVYNPLFSVYGDFSYAWISRLYKLWNVYNSNVRRRPWKSTRRRAVDEEPSRRLLKFRRDSFRLLNRQRWFFAHCIGTWFRWQLLSVLVNNKSFIILLFSHKNNERYELQRETKSMVHTFKNILKFYLFIILISFVFQPKATRPKPVYLWTTSDVQKWFRRHCSDFYTAYSDLIVQVRKHLTKYRTSFTMLSHSMAFVGEPCSEWMMFHWKDWASTMQITVRKYGGRLPSSVSNQTSWRWRIWREEMVSILGWKVEICILIFSTLHACQIIFDLKTFSLYFFDKISHKSSRHMMYV